MQQRIDTAKVAPGAFRAMLGLEHYIHDSGLEPNLIHMVKLRVSQINGCAYCIDMHWKDARAAGENEQRLYSLDAWQETPYYTDRERAAFEWAEAVTRITDGHVPDEVFERVRHQFSDKELADLTLAVTTINAWNRFSIAFRVVPGTYQPASAHPAPQPIKQTA
jgi:AhpD family alkylhydroperoxidase